MHMYRQTFPTRTESCVKSEKLLHFKPNANLLQLPTRQPLPPGPPREAEGSHPLLHGPAARPLHFAPPDRTKSILLKSYRYLSLSDSDRLMLPVRFARCLLLSLSDGLHESREVPWPAFGGYLKGLECALWHAWASCMQPLMVFGGSWVTLGVSLRCLGHTGAPNLHKAGRNTPFFGSPWKAHRQEISRAHDD